ncbi:DUF732 domain-containing protein [Nocardiopsis sp. NPDC049922]|uniref:DUF732 domain-containing protein n=1 Tax=Nocardiopsis sp. NPDC049922 TaxID=3155157 RepID=UPI0033E34FC7
MSAPSSSRNTWIIAGVVVLGLVGIGGIMQAAGLLDDVEPEPAASTPAPEVEESDSDQGPADTDTDDGDTTEGEQTFLDSLYEDAAAAGSGIRGFGDEDNLELGYAVCDDIEAGMAPTEVVQSLQVEDGPIADVATELVGHAQVYLCD